MATLEEAVSLLETNESLAYLTFKKVARNENDPTWRAWHHYFQALACWQGLLKSTVHEDYPLLKLLEAREEFSKIGKELTDILEERLQRACKKKTKDNAVIKENTLKALQRLSELGYKKASSKLFAHYQNSEWSKKAAMQDDSNAMFYLAKVLLNGKNEKEHKLALHWLEQSVLTGKNMEAWKLLCRDTSAQARLAQLQIYHQGKNPDEKNDDSFVQNKVTTLYTSIMKDENTPSAWKFFCEALNHREGWTGPKKAESVIPLLIKANNAGLQEVAQLEIARTHFSSTPLDYQKAFDALRVAVETNIFKNSYHLNEATKLVETINEELKKDEKANNKLLGEINIFRGKQLQQKVALYDNDYIKDFYLNNAIERFKQAEQKHNDNNAKPLRQKATHEQACFLLRKPKFAEISGLIGQAENLLHELAKEGYAESQLVIAESSKEQKTEDFTKTIELSLTSEPVKYGVALKALKKLIEKNSLEIKLDDLINEQCKKIQIKLRSDKFIKSDPADVTSVKFAVNELIEHLQVEESGTEFEEWVDVKPKYPELQKLIVIFDEKFQPFKKTSDGKHAHKIKAVFTQPTQVRPSGAEMQRSTTSPKPTPNS